MKLIKVFHISVRGKVQGENGSYFILIFLPTIHYDSFPLTAYLILWSVRLVTNRSTHSHVRAVAVHNCCEWSPF